jgi:hypothetical protein
MNSINGKGGFSKRKTNEDSKNADYSALGL